VSNIERASVLFTGEGPAQKTNLCFSAGCPFGMNFACGMGAFLNREPP